MFRRFRGVSAVGKVRLHARDELKNLQNLDEEEKASIVRLEAANLDTMQAWQIRMNVQEHSP
jgi:hypothetical protein